MKCLHNTSQAGLFNKLCINKQLPGLSRLGPRIFEAKRQIFPSCNMFCTIGQSELNQLFILYHLDI